MLKELATGAWSEILLPVIDLKGGQVVRGVAGNRAAYQPITSQLCRSASPADVARGLRLTYATPDVYVADLDAIAGCTPDQAGYEAISAASYQLWLDAGVNSIERALAVCEVSPAGSLTRLIIGLESLHDPRRWKEFTGISSSARLTFSLDLSDGSPLTVAPWRDWTPLRIAETVVEIGAHSILVLDLKAVGSHGGPTTLELCRELRRRFPHIELISGGGVRSRDDLWQFHAEGCDRVLVASALHDGCF